MPIAPQQSYMHQINVNIWDEAITVQNIWHIWRGQIITLNPQKSYLLLSYLSTGIRSTGQEICYWYWHKR